VLAVGMATELQPQAQFLVVGQQHAFARSIDQPARCGEMPGQAFAPERILGIAQQFGEQRDIGGLVRPVDCIGVECSGEGGVDLVHAASRHDGSRRLSPLA